MWLPIGHRTVYQLRSNKTVEKERGKGEPGGDLSSSGPTNRFLQVQIQKTGFPHLKLGKKG